TCIDRFRWRYRDACASQHATKGNCLVEDRNITERHHIHRMANYYSLPATSSSFRLPSLSSLSKLRKSDSSFRKQPIVSTIVFSSRLVVFSATRADAQSSVSAIPGTFERLKALVR